MRILPEEILNVLGKKFNAITDEQNLDYRIYFALKEDGSRIDDETYNKEMNEAVDKLKANNFRASRYEWHKRSMGVVSQTAEGEWYVNICLCCCPISYTVELCKCSGLGGASFIEPIASKVNDWDLAKEIGLKLINERRASYVIHPRI